ncbi:hypothetical protein TRIUR3_10521 [Triticum urartu]|uniref:Uncharacterized protein n=1 Tax=Triticum urartu TaxID=4572 RepID=M7ZND7_TRIUA|nr:hypothetical protein TRIUR3_10521 [Triticum urartu]
MGLKIGNAEGVKTWGHRDIRCVTFWCPLAWRQQPGTERFGSVGSLWKVSHKDVPLVSSLESAGSLNDPFVPNDFAADGSSSDDGGLDEALFDFYMDHKVKCLKRKLSCAGKRNVGNFSQVLSMVCVQRIKVWSREAAGSRDQLEPDPFSGYEQIHFLGSFVEIQVSAVVRKFD